VHDEYNAPTPKVTNIFGISGMMHSGQKVKENVTEDEKMGSVEHDEVHSEKPEMKGGEFLQERNIF